MKRGIFIAAAVIFSGYAQAQQDTATKTLDEVIVTANKFPQKQSTTGKVITVITKDQIEKSGGKSVGELLNEQTGISVSGALNNLGANQTVYLRGASAGRTLILMDGIPVYDPSVNNNYFDLNLVSLNNVESIEICRGAQSTLYGSDAIAGVINIITIKKDVTKPFNIKVTASAGNYNTFRGNAQLYGKANKFSYNIRYERLVSDGFSSAYDSTKTKDFDNDAYNGDVASASLQYQLTNDLSLKTFIQYSRYKTDLDAAAFTDEKDYSVKNNSVITGFNAHYQKNNISITGNYQYSENKRNYFNDSLDVPGFVTFATDNYVGHTQFAEVFSNIIISKNFSFLQGADYRYGNFHSRYFSLSSYGPFTTTFKDTSQSQASLYVMAATLADDPRLLQQLLDLPLQGRSIVDALDLVADPAASIDQERAGKQAHATEVLHRGPVCHRDRVRDVAVSKKLPHAIRATLVHRDAEHDEIRIRVTLVNRFEPGHLGPAWRTPSRPEVDEDDLSAELVVRDEVSIERLHLKRRSQFRRRRCGRSIGE